MNILSLILAALSAAPASAQAVRIGAAAAVQGAVKAAAPGAVGRVVQSGQPLFLNDHVTTDAKSRLQVMLLDETVFTIGPDSDMVLDEFVYDPKTDAGKVSARVTKGVFRFVTGKVARKDPSSMKVTLPVGTIGIRGTIGGGQTGEGGTTIVLLGPSADNNAGERGGGLSVGNAGDSVDLTRPGYGTTIEPGKTPTEPTDMSSFAANLSENLGGGSEGGSGGSGGSKPGSSQGGGSKSDDDDDADGAANPSQDSGHETAQGDVSADDAGDVAAVTEDLGETLAQAEQDEAEEDAAVDGATWEQVIAINQGTGRYSVSGAAASCSGGSCNGESGGTFDLTLDIDFTNRTYGGGSSQVSFNFSTSEFSDSSNITSTSYDGKSGLAKITLQEGENVNAGSNGSFNGTTIKLSEGATSVAGAEAAGKASIELNYVGQGATVTGSAETTLQARVQAE